MSAAGLGQILAYLVALTALAWPLGVYMSRLFERPVRRRGVEGAFLRLVGSDGDDQDWRAYTGAVLGLSVVSLVALFLLLRLQGWLPLNPGDLSGVGPLLALHSSASFVSSTNWQFFAGESTMSNLSQMAGLAVQNFIAPAVGLAVLLGVIRGFSRRSAAGLGNFWVDFYRALVHVLLPLAVLSSAILIAAGAPETLAGHATAHTLEGSAQQIARGPVATQVAIRTLGTNGGGFYNANGATPFENPNGFTNILLLILQLLIPVASVFMFGRMLGLRRQARVIFAVLVVLVTAGIAGAVVAEQHGSQVLRAAQVDIAAGHGQSGGNMADKEVRFGALTSALFSSATTASSGSGIDAGLDAMTPLGGGIPLLNMFTGIVGGVGSGLWSMLLKVVLAVFVASLMIGRTPHYLGKRIEANEMKLVALGLLALPVLVLTATALSIATSAGRASIFNPAAHGFTETLYAYTSQGNNNGSAFAGFGFTDFAGLLGTFAMLAGRFLPMVVVLALAGSLAHKRVTPSSPGTLRTDTLTFGVLLLGVIIVTSGLTILPAFVLGPAVEGLSG